MPDPILPLNLDPTTSVDPNYVVTAETYMLYQSNQRVPLSRAAHATSVVVTDVTDPANPQTLTENVDYTFATGDVDQTAMSKAYLEDADFGGILVSFITMMNTIPAGTKVKIQINFVTLEMIPAKYVAEGTDGPEPTRKLMADLIEQIDGLNAAFNPVTNLSTALIAPVKCLEEDRTGTNADNWIADELHSVDTLHSEQVILPACGSFYKHELTIRVASTNALLVEGTDYTILGANIIKTRASHHTSGVYDAIIITTRNLSTTVKISYHAYGGDFSYMDGYELKKVVTTILRFLAGIGYGGSTAASSCAELGDVYAVHDLNSGGNTGYHWLSIATLYLNDAAELLTRGVGTFRVNGISGTQFDLIFEVDLDLTRTSDPVKIRLLSGCNPVNHVTGTYTENILNQIIPRARVIWDAAEDSGFVLQFGFPIRTVDSLTTVIVENHSTTRSGWTLVTGGEVVFGDQDNNVALPYGGVWDEDTAEQDLEVLGFKDGVVLYHGYYEVDDNSDHTSVADDFDHADLIIPEATILTAIKHEDLPTTGAWRGIRKLTLEFIDRYQNTPITMTIPVGYYNPDGIAHGMFYPQDLCATKVHLHPALILEGYMQYRIEIVSILGANSRGLGMSVASSPMKRFALLAITAHFAGAEQ